ncbi:hypothetical protein [Streptomyces aureus]|uniref:hypothetical protein n=1 Tax=Streptomyces aureus TaxID=193461 RepID=UPI00362CB569
MRHKRRGVGVPEVADGRGAAVEGGQQGAYGIGAELGEPDEFYVVADREVL